MLSTLARASIEGALLAAAVWVVCRALPRLSPAARATLWWCVAAKFVVALLWRSPVPVPVLPAAAAQQATDAAAVATAPPASSRAAPDAAPPAPSAHPAGGEMPPLPWTAILLGAWGLGLGVSMLRLLRGWRHTRAVVSRSRSGDAALRAVVRDLSGLLGLRRSVDVRLSAEIASPLITGVRRPVILLPVDRFPSLSPEQQRMALCHELAHLKRGDVWLGCVPAAVERCFFFHPLARLAAREYAFWREAACDEAVLGTLGASPQSYGRLLLALGVSRQPAPFSAAGAAWSFRDLKRRITMLSRPSSSSLGGRVLAAGAVGLAVLAIAPVRAVARSVEPTAAAHAGSPAGAAAISESGATALAIVGPSTSTAASARPSSSATERAASTVAPAQERRRAYELEFVYFRDDDHTMMSGSLDDMARARRHLRAGEPMLWFRRDGREYVVRDPRLLREVGELWEPVSRIGEEQGKLGARQGALGTAQGRHGARQGEIGAKQGEVGARLGVVSSRLALLAAREGQGVSASERREIERDRERLERELRELEREMNALSEDMREFEPPMRELGEEMSALGRQMEVLGGRMEAASHRAEAGMRTLIDRAIDSGAAEVVR